MNAHIYYRDDDTQTVLLWTGGDYITEYTLRDEEIQTDAYPADNLTKNGVFPPSYLHEVKIQDLELELQEQIEYDLES